MTNIYCRNLLASASSIFALACFPMAAMADVGTEDTARGDPAADIVVNGERVDNGSEMTGSRLGLSVLETPASVQILTGDLIRERGDLSIIDAVTRATGISTAANGGNGGTALAARGFSGQGSVMQLYDGVRLYPGAGTVTFPFDPWTVERIEVLRGPASVLYGQGAIGGVINVISRKPNTQELEVQAEIGYGSQDTWHAAAGIGGPISDHLSYRFDASVRGSDGWVDNGQSRSHAISGILRYAPSDKLVITLSNDYGNQDPMDYYGIPLINGKLDKRLRRTNYEVADSVIHYRDNSLRLKAEWQISDSLSFTNSAYWLTTDRTWHNLETYVFNPVTGLVDRSGYFGGHHDQTQYGDQGSILISSEFGAADNNLVIGFDANSIKFKHSNNFTFIDTYSNSSPVPLLDFDPGLFVDPAFIVPAYRTKTEQLAFFAEDQLKLFDKFSIVAGIRHERATITSFSFTYDDDLNPTGQVRNFKRTLTNTTWRTGLVYQPTEAMSFYVQYTTGTDPLESLITTSATEAEFKFATGRQVEAGFKHALFDGRGEFTIAVYDIVKKNLLTIDPNDPTLIQQVGERSARGVEASLNLPLGSKLNVEVNGAVLQAKYSNFIELVDGVGVSRSGNRPLDVPEVTANLWVTYNPIERVQVQGGLRYVGDSFSDNANTLRNPSYLIADGSVSFDVNKNIRVRAGVQNLFDKIYVTNSYKPGQQILGRPRSFDVTLSAHF